ncbi:14 kDa phosphohistidine phosphatase isoform X2 [Equus asinus]|uniref:14 kDa phosphohistidine phosphatase isoform X2 n=1 Tax=Equus asinus TaxID=9793 RepID=UPI001D05B079|nr:14 kDa phosphohistidine phosphatase isoform X1 [Equus asinus]
MAEADLAQIPDVDIDSDGVFKYVLIRVHAAPPSGTPAGESKEIVRGYKWAEYHGATMLSRLPRPSRHLRQGIRRDAEEGLRLRVLGRWAHLPPEPGQEDPRVWLLHGLWSCPTLRLHRENQSQVPRLRGHLGRRRLLRPS